MSHLYYLRIYRLCICIYICVYVRAFIHPVGVHSPRGCLRRLGVHLTFVRSLNLDSWNEEQMKAMEVMVIG